MSKPRARTQTKAHAAGSVRIIGGQLKRRSVSFIDSDGLRPTPDRLRETLFNWLLADIHGARVLDSFAGSGVLGFEAVSRGAAHCTFIENNRLQAQMLQQSAEQLHLDPATYQIIHSSAEQALATPTVLSSPRGQQAFDVVFIDPPYAADLWWPILRTLIDQALIDANTLLYLEADKDLSADLEQLLIDVSIDTNEDNLTQSFIAFERIKHTKVGQVFAGLYRLVTP